VGIMGLQEGDQFITSPLLEETFPLVLSTSLQPLRLYSHLSVLCILRDLKFQVPLLDKKKLSCFYFLVTMGIESEGRMSLFLRVLL